MSDNINNESELENEEFGGDYDLNSIDLDFIGELEAQSDSGTDDFKEGNVILSKHSISGKHALKEDIIFAGKRKTQTEEEIIEDDIYKEKFSLPVTSIYYEESREPEKYNRKIKLRNSIYNILSANNTIDFSKTTRRKPSKSDFNNYFYMVKTQITKVEFGNENFSDVEIFVELAEFFIDNIESMFKLLDDKWRNSIFAELRKYVGKTTNKYEVKKTNLVEGTEIEFEYEDQIITGVIIESDYHNNSYVINTMMNIYKLSIDEILRITNNNVAHKYNLSKLDDADFL